MCKSTFLISYTINASTNENQNALNKGMREVFEKKSNCKNLDDTLWYMVEYDDCESISEDVVQDFYDLIEIVGDDKAEISVSVNEVMDWYFWDHKEVANWLIENGSDSDLSDDI